MATELPRNSVLTGGRDGMRPPHSSIASQRSAAAGHLGGAAAGPWPSWARAQLVTAIALAQDVPDQLSVASLLYRNWFSPRTEYCHAAESGLRRPLAGIYRTAHAGSRSRVRTGGVSVVQRHDVVRADGWWRTWGDEWSPPRTRPGSVRLLLTPRPDRLADFVTTVTAHLLPTTGPWSLGCATDPQRLTRYGGAVLDLPHMDAVPVGLVDELEPLLQPVVPPLCLPLAAGVGAAEYPDNGMTFGEHRCHLVALALRHPSSTEQPLRAIAAVFAAHGLDPAHPYRA